MAQDQRAEKIGRREEEMGGREEGSVVLTPYPNPLLFLLGISFSCSHELDA